MILLGPEDLGLDRGDRSVGPVGVRAAPLARLRRTTITVGGDLVGLRP